MVKVAVGSVEGLVSWKVTVTGLDAAVPPGPVQEMVKVPVCEIETLREPDVGNTCFSNKQEAVLEDDQDKVVAPGFPSDMIEVGDAESFTVGLVEVIPQLKFTYSLTPSKVVTGN